VHISSIVDGGLKGYKGVLKDRMKIGDFEFNLRELAGSMGDFGTLLPLAIGYMMVCKMNPAGLLIMMGLANIVTVIGSLVLNMAVGFVAGLAIHYLLFRRAKGASNAQ
jgi:hypothetical protein